MLLGLISDTHGYLDPKVADYFEPCQEIIHGGDIGSIEVLEALHKIKPTQAVFGNVDGPEIRMRCPEDLWLEREGLSILITHIAGPVGKYNSRIRAILQQRTPDLLICGHSHILKVMKDPVYHQMLHINPGAAGRQGLHHQKTIIRISLLSGRISDLEVIELGKRGSL